MNAADLGRIPPEPDLLCTDVDYKGVVYGTQLAIHFMRKNKVPGGKVVATGSVAAVVPHESYPEYDGAKAAVRCVEMSVGSHADIAKVVNFVRATARVLKDVSSSKYACTSKLTQVRKKRYQRGFAWHCAYVYHSLGNDKCCVRRLVSRYRVVSSEQ